MSGDTKTLYRGVLRAERKWEDPNVPIAQEELEANICELVQVTPEEVLKLFGKYASTSEHQQLLGKNHKENLPDKWKMH